ncbi:MAG TPA: iron-containing alcohol dehydrogenase [Firmicutes bacterium]|nr:iron-containing alcohol dehydrogenase [Bacillota bacterium]
MCTSSFGKPGQQFTWDNPPRVLFGPGSLDQIGGEVQALARTSKYVLLVTDRYLQASGVVSRVTDRLAEHGLDTTVISTEATEPDMESMRYVSAKAREKDYGAVVAVGGGSSMDRAKVAALMATNPGDVKEYCAPVAADEKICCRALPKVLVPTTSGTGSEVSNTAVLSENGIKTWITSSKMLAEVAVVDPTLTLTVPPHVTAGTGMDAISHCAEAVMSMQSNPLSDCMGLEGIRLAGKSLRRAYYWGEDLQARTDMSFSAMLGGWVIGFPWVGGPALLGHCVSEGISARYSIPHGVACGVVLPYIMQFNMPNCEEKLALIAAALGKDVSGLSRRAAAQAAVRAVLELLQDLNLPLNLRDAGVPESDLPGIADYMFKERQFMYDLASYNPVRLTPENTHKLMQDMYDGRIAA